MADAFTVEWFKETFGDDCLVMTEVQVPGLREPHIYLKFEGMSVTMDVDGPLSKIVKILKAIYE